MLAWNKMSLTKKNNMFYDLTLNQERKCTEIQMSFAGVSWSR